MNNNKNVHPEGLLLRISTLFKNDKAPDKSLPGWKGSQSTSGWNTLSSLGPRSGNRGSRINKETTLITAGLRVHARNDSKRGAYAFTLIELLVVVLIIGILSAIALPQYRLAVLKTRYMQCIVSADALWRAGQVYYLANNAYAQSLDELDISLQPDSMCGCNILNGGLEVDCQMDNMGASLYYVRRMENTRRICRSYPDRSHGDLATKLCLSFGGVENGRGEFVNYDLP